MELALSSKLKLGFVDGTCIKPSANSPFLMHWNRCNNMITSWILNSVSVDIRNSVVYIQSAREIWIDLEVRYAVSNIPKQFHLRKEIAHLMQETLSISAYFTKFRTVHDELECLMSKPRCMCNLCTCSVNNKLNELDRSVQLKQFLMGLNEVYTDIRGQILMMKPIHTLNHTYAMLLQEESQRNSQCGISTSSENVAMSVKNKLSGKSQVRNNFQRKGSDSGISYEFCHMPGHVKEKCYCIHGYPSWHKLFGKPKPKPKFLPTRNSVVASIAQTGNSTESVSVGLQMSSQSDLNLSESQCRQLIQMLQRTMTDSQQSTDTTIQTTVKSYDWPSINSVHFSGMSGHFVSQVHVIQSCNPSQWIIDTGARDHVTPFLYLLHNVQVCDSQLQLPNGERSIITHSGSLILSSEVTLYNVLCVPAFTYNLLSISKLLKVLTGM